MLRHISALALLLLQRRTLRGSALGVVPASSLLSGTQAARFFMNRDDVRKQFPFERPRGGADRIAKLAQGQRQG